MWLCVWNIFVGSGFWTLYNSQQSLRPPKLENKYYISSQKHPKFNCYGTLPPELHWFCICIEHLPAYQPIGENSGQYRLCTFGNYRLLKGTGTKYKVWPAVTGGVSIFKCYRSYSNKIRVGHGEWVSTKYGIGVFG